jgi:hypothetical protein
VLKEAKLKLVESVRCHHSEWVYLWPKRLDKCDLLMILLVNVIGRIIWLLLLIST